MDYNSIKNQEIKGKFVAKNVIENVTELITHLAKSEDKGRYEEKIYNLCSQPDYEKAAEDNGWEYDEDSELWKNDDYEDEYESAQDVCEYEGLDYEYIEPYEFWSVSDSLGKKLEEKGYIVQDVFGLCVWGRCTTGQAILLDYVISQICEDMEILEGQKYEW